MEHDDDDGEDVLDDEERAEAEGEEGEVCHKGTDPTMSKLKTGRGDDVRRRLMHLFVCSTIYMNEVLMVTLLFWFSLLFNFLPLDSEEKNSDSDTPIPCPNVPKVVIVTGMKCSCVTAIRCTNFCFIWPYEG